MRQMPPGVTHRPVTTYRSSAIAAGRGALLDRDLTPGTAEAQAWRGRSKTGKQSVRGAFYIPLFLDMEEQLCMDWEHMCARGPSQWLTLPHLTAVFLVVVNTQWTLSQRDFIPERFASPKRPLEIKILWTKFPKIKDPAHGTKIFLTQTGHCAFKEPNEI